MKKITPKSCSFLSSNVWNFSVVSFNSSELNFSHELPLGTIKNGREKVRMNPPKWRTISESNAPAFPTGEIVVFKNSKNMESSGRVERYDRDTVSIRTENGCEKVPLSSIKRKFENFEEYSKFVATQNLQLRNKVLRLKNVYSALPNAEKSEIMMPKNVDSVKAIGKDGRLDYDWPSDFGIARKTERKLNPPKGLIYRVGNLYGKNWSNSKNASYDALAIPYEENPSSHVTASFGRQNFRKKLQAIANGDLKKLNSLLSTPVSDEDFEKMKQQYKKFQEDFSNTNLNADSTMGISGKIAPWNGFKGGATQLLTPLSGFNMQKIETLHIRGDKK